MLGLSVQNTQLRDDVLLTWACNAQLIQMTRSCAHVAYWFTTLQFGFNLQPGNTVRNNSLIKYEIKPECVCCNKNINQFKSFAWGCLACTTRTKDTKLCTWGLWCTTPTSGTNILTSGSTVHNSNIGDKVTLVMPNFWKRFKVMHVGACGAQLTNSVQSYAHGGLCCIIPNEGAKLHKWWLVAHNFWKG